MTTRKAPEVGEENPKKKARVCYYTYDSKEDIHHQCAACGKVGQEFSNRQRNKVEMFDKQARCKTCVKNNVLIKEPKQKMTFGMLPTDCKVNVFSFLPLVDMNTVACCNKDCCKVRANESLDQKRTGTIVWTDRTTTISFCNKLRECQQKLTGNMTRLKVAGVERRTTDVIIDLEPLLDGVRLEAVTSLDCSCVDPYANRGGYIFHLRALSLVLPNLVELDLSHATRVEPRYIIRDFMQNCSFITKLTWNGCSGMNLFDGLHHHHFRSMTHLYVDSAELLTNPSALARASTDDSPEFYMFMFYPNLECLSVKDATTCVEEQDDDDLELANEPLSQQVLIKMARLHPKLRWLRSDLTADNVAMLKRERPEITFVSEQRSPAPNC